MWRHPAGGRGTEAGERSTGYHADPGWLSSWLLLNPRKVKCRRGHFLLCVPSCATAGVRVWRGLCFPQHRTPEKLGHGGWFGWALRAALCSCGEEEARGGSGQCQGPAHFRRHLSHPGSLSSCDPPVFVNRCEVAEPRLVPLGKCRVPLVPGSADSPQVPCPSEPWCLSP